MTQNYMLTWVSIWMLMQICTNCTNVYLLPPGHQQRNDADYVSDEDDEGEDDGYPLTQR